MESTTTLQDLSNDLENLKPTGIYVMCFELRLVLVGSELHGLVIFFMAFSGM